jgi:hypothetical protein
VNKPKGHISRRPCVTRSQFYATIKLPIDSDTQLMEEVMDFIEQLFGISPDGGSGALEFALFVIPVVAGLVWAMYRRRYDMGNR